MRHYILLVCLAAGLAWGGGSAVRPVFPCPMKPDPPPSIDGDGREWDHLPGAVEIGEAHVTWGKANWQGVDDLSGTLQFCYDSNYFYVLADVVDDVVTIGGGKDMFSCDHVELTFAPVFAEKGTGPRGEDWRIIGFSPGTQEASGDIFSDLSPEAYLHSPINTDSSAIDVASRPTEKGYVLEARIPWRLLGVKGTPQPGAVFGFDLHFSDSDSGTSQETLTSLNTMPWRGRHQETILKLVLTGTDGKLPQP